METSTHSQHHRSSLTSFDNMISSDPPTFLKLEDLDNSASPSYPLNDNMSLQATPPPVIVHSKAAKKRKSWGQELPEPTTNLPPRKRAKTDDEKEQRRIERIKRNRAAAHNSRERKRQETEVLAVALARANAELDAYRKHFGSLPAGVVLPEVTLSIDDDGATPAPSLIESHGTVDATATTPSTPVDDLFDYAVQIKEEEESTDCPFPTSNLPPAFEDVSKPSPALTQTLDLTQHSAAMLCDLQCRSSLRSHHKSSTGMASTSTTSWWTHLIICLLHLQLPSGYKAILLGLWTLSPSRTARLMQASTHRLTSRSRTSSTRTPLLSQSTRALAQRNAATALVSALQRTSSAVEVPRASRARAVAKQPYHSSADLKVFEEQDAERDLGDGNGNHGVGR